jgi:MFS family permease
MAAAAGLTLVGAFIALITLPEVETAQSEVSTRALGPLQSVLRLGPAAAVAFALYGVNRLVVPGVLNSTLGLLLEREVGTQIDMAGRSIGVATLTGSGLGLATLIAMASAPALGALSDRTPNRWSVVVAGLGAGVAGFVLLTVATPWSILAGIPLTAVASGSNQSLSITLISDLSEAGEWSKRLGLLFTLGDLASAVGPPLAYALIPLLGIRGNYLLSAGVLALMLLAALWLAIRVSEA